MIASATDRELAKHVEFLKEENKILRSRLGCHVHTEPAECERPIKLGKQLGRAIEKLITIVSPATFYRWLREEKAGPKRKRNPKGGQRKPKELRELVLLIATTTGLGYTKTYPQCPPSRRG